MTNIRSKASAVSALEEESKMTSSVLEQQIPPAPPTPVQRYSDPAVRMKAHCGCGFSCHTLLAAADHARSLGHTLTISGEVRAQF